MYDARLTHYIDRGSHLLYGEVWHHSPHTGKELLIERRVIDTDVSRIHQTRAILEDSQDMWMWTTHDVQEERLTRPPNPDWYSGVSILAWTDKAQPLVMLSPGTARGIATLHFWKKRHPIIRAMSTQSMYMYIKRATEDILDEMFVEAAEEGTLRTPYQIPAIALAYVVLDFIVNPPPQEE